MIVMNKLLSFVLLGFLTFNLLGQRVNKLALKIENDKVFQNNTFFSGQMYELYQSGFLKSLSNIKNGVLDGEVSLFTDNYKSYSSYQDSTILKSFEDSLKVYSKMLFEFQKDSAKYDHEVSTIFNEEIKTKENLDEWIEKYESGKLNKKKTAIYEELKTASYNLERARVDLKIIREKNLNCQIRRKKEREKPIYQNVLTDRYQYSNGVKSGKHEIYSKDGKITQQEYFTNDVLNGEFKKFDSYGKLIESGTFVNGKKEGEWKTYDTYGKLTKLETYLDNKKNGKYQEFQNEKLLSEGRYKDNLKDGECKTFDYYGKLSVLENYKLDKREGSFKKYSGDIITEEGQYVGGLMNGECKTYSNNGKLTSLSYYLNGKLNGLSKKYSGDIVVEEGQYVDGLMNGEWVFRYDNGNLKGKGKYINGDGGNLGTDSKIPRNGREGLWVIYHENGNKSQECSYINGNSKFEGNFQIDFNEDGSIKVKWEYKNGKWEQFLTSEEREKKDKYFQSKEFIDEAFKVFANWRSIYHRGVGRMEKLNYPATAYYKEYVIERSNTKTYIYFLYMAQNGYGNFIPNYGRIVVTFDEKGYYFEDPEIDESIKEKF
jgi:antitoxin component YwqK of YwqJK toxin-antitoxin module